MGGVAQRSRAEGGQHGFKFENGFGVFAFGVATAPLGWVPPTAFDLLFMTGLGISSMLSLYCVVRSLKLASASVVVPYQYTLILWSVLFGWQMFGELPDAYTIVGATIIVAAGLYIFWREQAAAKVPLTPGPETP